MMRTALALLLLIAAPAVAQEERPRLLNAREVSDSLEAYVPTRVRLLGLGGTARFRVFIDEKGQVDTVRVWRSTGLTSLDMAGERAVRHARFAPATRNGDAFGLWTEIPLTFQATPMDSAPPAQLLVPQNRGAVSALAARSYPGDMSSERVGAHVGVSLSVDASGAVSDSYIVETSCFRSADLTALELLRQLRFPVDTIAVRRTLATVQFGRGDYVGIRLLGDAEPLDFWRQLFPAPSPAGVTKAPYLENARDVQRALSRRYPPDERDAGEGGETVVRFHVGTDGRADFRSVSIGSGKCAFDAAALAVSEVMRFSPAIRNGVPVPIWVEIPIVFRAL